MNLIQKDVSAWQTGNRASPVYAPDWLIERYKSELDLKTAEGKKAFTECLLATIRQLSDPVEQEHYLKKIAGLTDSSFEAIKAKFAANQRYNALRA